MGASCTLAPGEGGGSNRKGGFMRILKAKRPRGIARIRARGKLSKKRKRSAFTLAGARADSP